MTYTHFVTGPTYNFADKLRKAGGALTTINGVKGWMITAEVAERITGESYYGPKMARLLTVTPLAQIDTHPSD